MKNWFTIDQIDADTHIISEYRHWEETHCYLLEGEERCLLIDTGLGICNISEEVKKLTDKPVTAVATHIHWDHIGGHEYYPDFYAHEAELDCLVAFNVIGSYVTAEGFLVEPFALIPLFYLFGLAALLSGLVLGILAIKRRVLNAK